MKQLTPADIALPVIVKERHKYQAGHVVGIAGSHGMAGAAMLSSWAALRAGAGIVRLFHPENITAEFVGEPWEVIRVPYNDPRECLNAVETASSFFVGPGLGAANELLSLLFHHMKAHQLFSKAVLDADCLNYMAATMQPHDRFEGAILTPHMGEMKRLLHEEPNLEAVQAFSEKTGAYVLLKGAPTYLFSPDKEPLRMDRGDPGMATAGSGDVLTGIIAAFRAEGLSSFKAMCSGAYIHAVAGEIAAKHETSYAMTASSIINSLPEAFQTIQIAKSI